MKMKLLINTLLKMTTLNTSDITYNGITYN